MRKIYLLLACVFASFVLKAQTGNTVNFNFLPDPLTNNVVFTNTSVLQGDGVKKAFWYFGDGSMAITGPLAGITHHYNTAGAYQVCLKVWKYSNTSNDSLLLGSECKSVTLQQHCTAGFQWADSVTTNPLLHHVGFFGFGNSNSNKPIREVCWNFGDGTDTCIVATLGAVPPLNIRHKYTQNGTYNVCIRIKYDGGCVAEKCNTVVLSGPTLADSCAANFTIAPVSSVTSLARKFIAQPWHNKNKKPVRICWEFGDGKDTCIQYPTSYTGDYFVEHRYLQPGQYNVCVIIKYDGGCEKRKCNLVNVPPVTLMPDSCKADFTIHPITATPLGRKFTAMPWHNRNKKPVRICWTFGDGKDTCIQYPTNYTGDYWVEHKYTQPGQYEVCVNIKYDGGCEKRTCRMVEIAIPQDVCSFDLTEIPVTAASLERKFYVGLMPNRRAEKICWSFGDGTDTCVILSNPVNPQQLIITHHYAAPGNYTVCAKVYYAGGCVVQKCKQVVINIPHSNICGGYVTDSAISANTIRFKGTGIQNPNDFVTSYSWSFGDGTTGTGQLVNHTYPGPGRYNVCLVIRTNSGCETKICKGVAIAGNAQPQLVLTPNPVTTVLNATFLSLLQQTITVKIYNASGIMVRSYVRNANVGTNTWVFTDVGTLPTGVYSVIVQSPNQFATAIFFKQ